MVSSGKNSFSEGGRMTRIFRLLGTMATVALVLAIYAGTSSNGSGSTSTTLRHVSSILFAVLYFFLVAVHVMCWLHVDTLMKHRRFVCISLAHGRNISSLHIYSCSSVSHPLCHSSASVCYTPYFPLSPARSFPLQRPRQNPTRFRNLTLPLATGGYTSLWGLSWSSSSSSSTPQSEL